MLSPLGWLRIGDLAGQLRASPNLSAVGANGSKVSSVVDHNVGIFRHPDNELAEINMGCVGHVTGYSDPTEIDRELANIGRIAGR